MIYERDYSKLTKKEEDIVNKIKKSASKKGRREYSVDDVLKYPKAAFFFESLFPNNMLDTDDLRFNDSNQKLLQELKELIDNESTTERQIVNFIKSNRAYFIIASVLTDFRFGHHNAYAFPEFELPPDYKADCLIIGESSYGHEFIFIELENPHNNITTKDGSFGETFRKGIRQIENWNSWIEENFSHLELVFRKHKGTTCDLPREFLKLDTTRIHYVVIAGRRKDFNEKTYRLARQMKAQRIGILHYDNLLDKTEQILRSENFI